MLASSKAAVLDQKVEVKFGGCQSNKIEGAQVLDDHGVTVPTLYSLPPAFIIWERNNPIFNLSHCYFGLCYR